ncbi:MAG: hypothetical protein OK438_08080 [Thaumarchaeota archaeon]|nr:hypothetical protein [Nitrososphaerota archaeon]
MKRSQALAISVVALFVLAAVPFQQTQAAGAYSEKLQVFVAGSSAFWYFTFNGINGSSKLAAFESSPGLGWYNITAIRTTTWKSDFQVFGPQGYNLIPVPYIPAEGLFLTLGSDSYSDALSAARALNSYMVTAFISYSNGTGTFTFYSPLSFNDVVPGTLLKLIPSSAGGFAPLVTPSAIQSSLSPLVVVEGTKSTSGFDHSIVVGSITATALDAQNKPAVLGYFGTSPAFITASSLSASSTIQARVLDGQLTSKDKATVTNDPTHFTASYSLALGQGQKVHSLNATMLQHPLGLIATRLVDAGVLNHLDNDSISVSLLNLSNSTQVTHVSGTDNWWDPTMFKLVRHTNSTLSQSTLPPGGRYTLTYVLQYIGSSTEAITIPPATVKYSYADGPSTFNATARTNPVVLSLGASHADVFAYVIPTGGYGKSVGSTQGARIIMRNVGTQTASSVTVAGKSLGSIPQGSTASLNVSLSAESLLGSNLTKSYSVSYTDLEGGSLTATTNALPVVLSHSAMQVGYAQLVLSSALSPLKAGGTNLTLTLATSNIGPSNVTSFLANEALPAGIGCESVSGTGATCSSGVLKLTYASIKGGTTMRAYLKFNVTSPLNYFFAPADFGGLSAGLSLTGRSTALAAPTGFVISKAFAPSKLFGGMASKVGLQGFNNGPFNIYNTSITSAVDSFDQLSASAIPSTSAQVLSPGANVSASYSVTALSSVSGDRTATPVYSSVFFGGRPFTLKGLGPVVSVYAPLSATITTSPTTPTEGKNFTISIGINNPSGVDVSQVLFTLPVPSGLGLSLLKNAQLSGGVLTVSASQLSAHGVYNASMSAVASSGITIPFDKAKLSFAYGGVTVSGKTPPNGIAIGENVTTRYLLPSALVFLALLATAYYIRKKSASTVRASQK